MQRDWKKSHLLHPLNEIKELDKHQRLLKPLGKGGEGIL